VRGFAATTAGQARKVFPGSTAGGGQVALHLGCRHLSGRRAHVDGSDHPTAITTLGNLKLMGMGALAVVELGGTALGVSIAGVFEQLSRFFRG